MEKFTKGSWGAGGDESSSEDIAWQTLPASDYALMSERQAPSYKMHSDWQTLLRAKRMVDDDRFHKRGDYRDLLNDYEVKLRIFMSNHFEEMNRIFYGQEIQK